MRPPFNNLASSSLCLGTRTRVQYFDQLSNEREVFESPEEISLIHIFCFNDQSISPTQFCSNYFVVKVQSTKIRILKKIRP